MFCQSALYDRSVGGRRKRQATACSSQAASGDTAMSLSSAPLNTHHSIPPTL